MSAPGPPDAVDPTEPTEPEAPAPSPRALRRRRRRARIRQRRAEERTPALDAYVARTQTGLDLLALCTIWLSFLPLTGGLGDARGYWLVGRLALSLVFLADLLARTRRAAHPGRYWRTHPLLVAAVLLPPVRVLFSLRLLGEVFRRGNLARFVLVAVILAVNIAIVVWAFEHADPAANIDSIWIALWWAVVTVTTTGYGDYTPITVGGRLTAVALMALGLTTLAVITAQVASSFQEQAARLRPTPAPDPHLAELRDQVHRLEALIVAQATPGRDRAEAPPEGPSPGARG